jgi:hypothetical protein
MPAFIRLVVGVIVLLVVELVVTGFPGLYNLISGTQVTGLDVALFIIGLIAALIILKFGTQLTNAVSDAYKAYKNWTPLLGYFFQITAIVIIYSVSYSLAAPYLGSAPWTFSLIFLLIALVPTIKVTVNLVHAFEGSTPPKHGHDQQN